MGGAARNTKTKRPNFGGRPKGSVNKFTGKAKEAFALAFKGMGGVGALTRWAKRNPGDFFKLYARLIPVEIGGSGEDGAIKIVISSGDAKM